MVHIKKLLAKLKAEPRSTSLFQDNKLISRQIATLNRCLEADANFFMNIAAWNLYFTKYHTNSHYADLINKLNLIA